MVEILLMPEGAPDNAVLSERLMSAEALEPILDAHSIGPPHPSPPSFPSKNPQLDGYREPRYVVIRSTDAQDCKVLGLQLGMYYEVKGLRPDDINSRSTR